MIIDATVLVAALVDTGPEGLWAEAIVAQSPRLAPELARVEATNVLRRLQLAGTLGAQMATAAHDDLMRLPMQHVPFVLVAERVWALRHTITSYDAFYVAVAEHAGLPLATLDRRLAQASGPRCAFVVPPR